MREDWDEAAESMAGSESKGAENLGDNCSAARALGGKGGMWCRLQSTALEGSQASQVRQKPAHLGEPPRAAMGLAGGFWAVACLTACRRGTCDSGWAERLLDRPARKSFGGDYRMYRYMGQSFPKPAPQLLRSQVDRCWKWALCC